MAADHNIVDEYSILRQLVEKQPCRHELVTYIRDNKPTFLVSYTGTDPRELQALRASVDDVFPKLFGDKLPTIIYCQALPWQPSSGVAGLQKPTTRDWLACLQKPVTKDWLSHCGVWTSPYVAEPVLPLLWGKVEEVGKELGFGIYATKPDRFAAYLRLTRKSDIFKLCPVCTRQDVADVCRLLGVLDPIDFVKLSEEYDRLIA